MPSRSASRSREERELREPAFEWYSTTAPGARLRAASHRRATLRAYFRGRIRQHERLRLTRLKASYELRRDLGNFYGTLVRSADDLEADTSLQGSRNLCGRASADRRVEHGLRTRPVSSDRRSLGRPVLDVVRRRRTANTPLVPCRDRLRSGGNAAGYAERRIG